MKALRLLKNNFFIILCLLTIFALTSCGGNMTDELVRAELERLLPISYELNEIFWGKGLPTQDLESSDKMQPVTEDCGYKSTEDILNKASEVFSEEYVQIIKDAIFTDDDNLDPRYADVNGVLKADTSNKGFNIQGNIVLESVKIKKQNRGMIIVTADYEDGGSTQITLINQNGAWYLNSPTY